MTAIIPHNYQGVVVELGPGTGVFTHAILEKLGVGGRLIAFEIHRPFTDFLRKNINDHRLTVVENYAQSAPEELLRLGIRDVMYVISGLPILTAKKTDRDALFNAVYQVLSADGVYVQLQYLPLSLFYVRKKFSNVRVASYELRNFPPAFVYEARK